METVITSATSSNILSGRMAYSSTTVGTIDLTSLAQQSKIIKNKLYQCAYCGIIHESKIGHCTSCGAPLSEAIEV